MKTTKLNHKKKIENWRRLIAKRRWIDLVIKNHPPQKSIGPYIFFSEFYHMFKEDLTSIILNYSKTGRGGRTSKFTSDNNNTASASFANGHYSEVIKESLNGKLHPCGRCSKNTSNK